MTTAGTRAADEKVPYLLRNPSRGDVPSNQVTRDDALDWHEPNHAGALYCPDPACGVLMAIDRVKNTLTGPSYGRIHVVRGRDHDPACSYLQARPTRTAPLAPADLERVLDAGEISLLVPGEEQSLGNATVATPTTAGGSGQWPTPRPALRGAASLAALLRHVGADRSRLNRLTVRYRGERIAWHDFYYELPSAAGRLADLHIRLEHGARVTHPIAMSGTGFWAKAPASGGAGDSGFYQLAVDHPVRSAVTGAVHKMQPSLFWETWSARNRGMRPADWMNTYCDGPLPRVMALGNPAAYRFASATYHHQFPELQLTIEHLWQVARL